MTRVYEYYITSSSALSFHFSRTQRKKESSEMHIQKWSSIIKITENVVKTTDKSWQTELTTELLLITTEHI